MRGVKSKWILSSDLVLDSVVRSSYLHYKSGPGYEMGGPGARHDRDRRGVRGLLGDSWTRLAGIAQ